MSLLGFRIWLWDLLSLAGIGYALHEGVFKEVF